VSSIWTLVWALRSMRVPSASVRDCRRATGVATLSDWTGAASCQPADGSGGKIEGAGGHQRRKFLLQIGGELTELREQFAVGRVAGEPLIQREAIGGRQHGAVESGGPERRLLLGGRMEG
jgi:hypothetical protein